MKSVDSVLRVSQLLGLHRDSELSIGDTPILPELFLITTSLCSKISI
jgi:hypothetical protein